MAHIVNFRLKTTIMRRRLRAELAATRGGRRAGIRVLGSTIIDNLRSLSPVDTRRYLRGWIQAGVEAGVTSVPAPSLRPSRYHAQSVDAMERYIERLEETRDILQEQIDRWYPNGPPKKGNGTYQNLILRLGTAERRVVKARIELEELERDPYAVVFGAGRIIDRKGTRLGIGRVSFRTKVYGGTGRIIDGPGASVLYLRNMEPHARILEWKRGVMKTATAAARSAGVIPIRAAYIKTLRQASRVSGGGASNGRRP